MVVPLPPSPQPPLLPDTGLLRERLAGLGMRRECRDQATRETEEEGEEEEEEEEQEATPEEGERGGDLELDLEKALEDEEHEAAKEEEEGLASIPLLSLWLLLGLCGFLHYLPLHAGWLGSASKKPASRPGQLLLQAIPPLSMVNGAAN